MLSMTFNDGFIYTTGFIDEDDSDEDMIATKWTTDGDIVWQTRWGGDYSQVGIGVAASDDSVYVVVSDFDQMGFPGYMNSSILKLDTEGNILWNKTLPDLLSIWDNSGELYIQGEYMYFIQYWGITILEEMK